MTLSDPDLQSASSIQTFTGEMFDVFAPNSSKIQVKDIAHALSMLCRYGGHSRDFYSVAEHSVLMAGYFEARGEYDLARAALLHDSTEAYMGDMVRPLKLQLPLYREVEGALQGAIFNRFGLPPDMPPEVKEADLRICNDERAVLLYPLPWNPFIDSLPPLGVELKCWFPIQAEQQWFDFYWRLFA